MMSHFLKWAIFSALFAVGFIGLLILAGDDDPYNPMPLGRWFMLKAMGAALMYAAYRIGRLLDRYNLLPEFKDLEEDEL